MLDSFYCYSGYFLLCFCIFFLCPTFILGLFIAHFTPSVPKRFFVCLFLFFRPASEILPIAFSWFCWICIVFLALLINLQVGRRSVSASGTRTVTFPASSRCFRRYPASRIDAATATSATQAAQLPWQHLSWPWWAPCWVSAGAGCEQPLSLCNFKKSIIFK